MYDDEQQVKLQVDYCLLKDTTDVLIHKTEKVSFL